MTPMNTHTYRSCGRRDALLLMCLFLSACERTPSTPTRTTPSSPPLTPVFLEAPVPKPLKVPSEHTDKASQRPDDAEMRKNRRAILELLVKGRAEVKRGDYAAGIASYQQALAIDPNHAQLLSELGWAAFKSRDLDLAQQATTLSVRYATSPSIKGASLYNLGRIAEAHEQPALAVTHYQSSLAARPGNAIVQARLDALLAQGMDPASEEDEGCAFSTHQEKMRHDATSLTLCQAFTQHVDRACSDEQPSLSPITIGEYTLRSFATEPEDDDGHSRFIYLAVLGANAWYSALIGIEYNPGVGYIHDELGISSMKAHALLPDTTIPQVMITIEHHYTDGDYPQNEAVNIDVALSAMIDLNGATPRWVASSLASHKESIDKMIDEEDGIDHGKNFPRSWGSAYTISWGDEHYVTTLTSGKAHPKSPAGRYAYQRPLARCPASQDFLL